MIVKERLDKILVNRGFVENSFIEKSELSIKVTAF